MQGFVTLGGDLSADDMVLVSKVQPYVRCMLRELRRKLSWGQEVRSDVRRDILWDLIRILQRRQWQSETMLKVGPVYNIVVLIICFIIDSFARF